MANFQTHLNGGIVVSAAVTLGLHTAGVLQEGQTLTYFALGVVGSLLPDIDSDVSKPANALFSVLGAGLAFVMTLPLMGRFLPLELVFIWLGVFLCVRYGFFEIFARFTVHRGVWHSWLGIAAATLGSTNLAYWVWHLPPRAAWIAGLVVGIGYLTHLLLDELSSVDLFNSRVKRSFGTALKPFSLDDPLSSAAMLTVVLTLAWLAPASDVWQRLEHLTYPGQWQELARHLLHGLETVWTRLAQWWQQLPALPGGR